jgi:hypothetical protein
LVLPPRLGNAQSASQGESASRFERCKTIPDGPARLSCYEKAAGLNSSSLAAALPNGWHLARTPNPRGGPEAVAAMRTADLSRSDIGLAGIMLSCAENGTEVIIVVVTPFPPRARPNVSVGAGAIETMFRATVVPPGAELRLPPEAAVLASGPWQASRELAVRVTSEAEEIKGVVPTDGLGSALATLRASCPM